MADDNPPTSKPTQDELAKAARHELTRAVELFWSDHCDWLKEKGYILRPRYQPGWVPTWIATKKSMLECEDRQTYPRDVVMDATRISDGAFVMLKYIKLEVHPHEVEIGTWFSQEPQASDPDNHCVPIFDVLDVPDVPGRQIIVMPLLRNYDKPRFDTFGEAVEFFSQIFKGLRYMHRNNVAHRDCMSLNIMVDATPLYPIPYHPVNEAMKRDYSGRVSHLTRTQRPVKYYLTDFGISRRYPPGVRAPLEPIIEGGDRTVPEFKRTKDGRLPQECDPFPTDVYYMGNLIRKDFINGTHFVKRKLGFEFMLPLMNDMFKTILLRPTMDELRSRVVMVDDDFGFYHAFRHWARKLILIVKNTPAIPTP
ncbi:hypothetical protein B0H10DRAFT_1987354 [Mycena sp. CBHHK59/15]|nr:hypothetical protein B0H10DRAFT_1987354 [Mycena sp. CBHHK59/15]